MCRHHHHDHEQEHDQPADKWTNTAAAGEAIASFISDGYWFASLFDIVSGLEPDVIEVSYWGLGFGVVMGLLTAAGAMYCHRELNTHHQPTPAHNHSHDIENQAEAPQVINEHTHASTHYINPKLTWLQVAALICDGASHAGDIVGPMTFVVNIATKNSLPRWGKGLVQAGATLFGGVCSKANVRSCYDAMKKRNARIFVPADEESNLLGKSPN